MDFASLSIIAKVLGSKISAAAEIRGLGTLAERAVGDMGKLTVGEALCLPEFLPSEMNRLD